MTDRTWRILTLGAFLGSVAGVSASHAQSKPDAPAFEVASIRPAAPQNGPVRSLGGVRSDPGRVSYTNVTLRQLLQRAYGVRPPQIAGPGWLDGDRFDIVAKLPEGATEDRVPRMLQNLLVERFQLELRVEKKEMPVYALVAGKNGPKLEKAEEGEPPPGPGKGGINIGTGSLPGWVRITATHATLSLFADSLSIMMDRPVIDETAMQGRYNFTFETSADDIAVKKPGPAGPDGGGAAKGDGGPAPSPDSTPAPSLFTAIQKVGLRLEPRKAPLDFIVVEKGNRVPTEN
jgi:uncharacterized protein (TIGR03435 family)